MPTQQLDYFTSLVAEDEHLPLTEAAIAVAQHAYPDLDVQGVLDHLDQLGNKLKELKFLHIEIENSQDIEFLEEFRENSN